MALIHSYDWLGRRTNVKAMKGATQLLSHNYAYDNATRLTNVADGPFHAFYASYLPTPTLPTARWSARLRIVRTASWP